jgi:hypothetical protein
MFVEDSSKRQQVDWKTFVNFSLPLEAASNEIAIVKKKEYAENEETTVVASSQPLIGYRYGFVFVPTLVGCSQQTVRRGHLEV